MAESHSEILSVNCPACGHGMNLQRQHLGIRGKCVRCSEPLVATERPGIGVVAINPDAPEEPPLPPERERERETPPIEFGRESLGGVAHHSPRDQDGDSGFSSPAGISESTSQAESKFGFPGGAMPGLEEGTTAPGLESSGTAPGGHSQLEEGFASLFKKRDEDAEEAPGKSDPLPSPPSTVPERNLGGDHPSLLADNAEVPWAEDALRENPFDPPKAPNPSDEIKDPFADRLQNPISQSVSQAIGIVPPEIEQALEGSAAGSWPGSMPVGEAEAAGSPETPEERPAGGLPGVSVAQLSTGRRNIFVRFFLGLMKLTLTLAVLAGIGVGAYFLTPPATAEKWKEAAIEWLQPGLVLREHLPFKVPFLEELARDEMLENGAAGTVTHSPAAASEGAGADLETGAAPAEAPALESPGGKASASGAQAIPGPAVPADPPEKEAVAAPAPENPAVEKKGPETSAAVPPVNEGAPPVAAVGPPAPSPAHAAVAVPVPPQSEAANETTDPSKMLEPMGRVVLTSFYQAQSIEDRRQYLVDSQKYGPAMEAFYGRYKSLPTLKNMVFRGPMRDASSGRWFGVFDVHEEQNDEVHRWCAVQVGPGKLKLDWGLYQQLTDRSLERFLSDPASPPKVFRALINRGEPVLESENPWSVPAVELFLRTPLDTAKARRIVMAQNEFHRHGLSEYLVVNHARIAEVELSWIPGVGDPSKSYPTLTGIFAWGAW